MSLGEEEEPPRETFATAAIALSTGKGRLKARQLDDAADALGQALEMSIAEHGEESSAVAEYYFAYGDVLLSIVEKELVANQSVPKFVAAFGLQQQEIVAAYTTRANNGAVTVNRERLIVIDLFEESPYEIIIPSH